VALARLDEERHPVEQALYEGEVAAARSVTRTVLPCLTAERTELCLVEPPEAALRSDTSTRLAPEVEG